MLEVLPVNPWDKLPSSETHWQPTKRFLIVPLGHMLFKIFLFISVSFKVAYVNLFLFTFWPCCLACRILVLRQGIEPVPPAVEGTTREVPWQILIVVLGSGQSLTQQSSSWALSWRMRVGGREEAEPGLRGGRIPRSGIQGLVWI